MLKSPKLTTILVVGVLLMVPSVAGQDHQPPFYFGGGSAQNHDTVTLFGPSGSQLYC